MQIPGYRIVRKINQGGMSTVYLAIQLSVGREVALKVMSPALNADPIFSERFQREANIVGQLSHPNIVAIYDIGRHKNLNYIAMDYLPGGSVHDKIAVGLSPQQALRIISEIAQALDHAHDKGYIHRDIKPENILFRADDSAVLSDFGVAKTLTSASKMTTSGTVVGTPHYMSPEQARGKPIDGRSDLYSLGVVLYEMLTGSVPFQAEEAIAIALKHLTAPIPKLPPQYGIYQDLLNKLLAKDADDRFQRGRDCVTAIEQFMTSSPGSAPPYLTQTEPTAVEVFALFKILLQASYTALNIQLKALLSWLGSWRIHPKRGIYQQPQTTVTAIYTRANSGNSERATIISTRVQRAAYYQQIKSSKLRRALRIAPLALVLICIWAGFSVAVTQFNIFDKDQLPVTVAKAAQTTSNLLALKPLSTTNANTNEVLTPSITSTSEIIAPTEQEPVEPPPPPRYSLTVDATPATAKIRILNIVEKYTPGINLLPGNYHIEVAQTGYDTFREWIAITDTALAPQITLRETPVAGTIFYHDINSNGDKGPAMVVIPAGKFVMGNKNDIAAAPIRQVQLKQPFAVSQYEITFADYDQYTKATNAPSPDDKGWGRDNRPVINVSWEEAMAYTQWLQKTTGHKYRLASEAEWEYIATAGKSGEFWWGEDNHASGKANCRRGCASEYAGLFSVKTAPVGSYEANPFRVFDTAGNVAEWVADCYQDGYEAAPQDGGAFTRADCTQHSVRGGSIQNTKNELSSRRREAADTTKQYKNIGFRVVVELY